MKYSGLVLVAFVIAVFLLIGLGYYSVSKEKKAIYGVDFKVKDEIFVHNAAWFFNKPKVSVTYVTLNEKDLSHFINPPQDFFSDYPHFPDSKYKDWKIMKWQKTDPALLENKYFKFLLNSDEDSFFVDEAVMPDILKVIKLTEKLLQGNDNYVSMLYHTDKKGKISANLYLISPGRNQLIEIKRN